MAARPTAAGSTLPPIPLLVGHQTPEIGVAYLDRIQAVADQATRILRSDASSNERLACGLQAVTTHQTKAELAALVRNRRGKSQHRRAADPFHADDQAFAVDQITIAGRDDLLRSQ